MAAEIERKFLVDELPRLDEDQMDCLQIKQGYLAIEADGAEVRLRRVEDDEYITVKTSGDLVRGEFETSLLRTQFNLLWVATEGRRIEKERWRIPLEGDLVAELDIFQGTLQGLALVEVEFETIPQSESFVPPSWFGTEVTAYGFFKNRNLATTNIKISGDYVMKDGVTISVPEIKTP